MLGLPPATLRSWEERDGVVVRVARTAAEAERILAEQGVDLAIIDLMIGGGAGLHLCREFSERVPVLAVSALDQEDAALAGGAQGFIRKPLESLVLVSAT